MNKNDRKIALGACVVAIIALTGVFIFQGDDIAVGNPELIQGDSTAFSRETSTSSISRDASFSRNAGSYRDLGAMVGNQQQPVETFPFDPNTADSTQLRRLGLTNRQVSNIYKYRSRGGVFRRKEDFARLYGLTIKDYRRLEPYIRISSDYLPASTLYKDEKPTSPDTLHRHKISESEHIVLNTADTTTLMTVPGIGSYYAKEIVRYGKRLGGFVSVDQLDEIDNFPQSAKKYFVIENPTPQLLHINKLSLQQLRRHPYLNYYQAKTIIDYRQLHGNIHDLEELRLSRDFTPEAIARLKPYVKYE